MKGIFWASLVQCNDVWTIVHAVTEYAAAYCDFDLTVTTCVHDAGLCASLGIREVLIQHTGRSATDDGFLAKTVEPEHTTVDNAMDLLRSMDVAAASRRFVDHQRTSREQYLQLLSFLPEADPPPR